MTDLSTPAGGTAVAERPVTAASEEDEFVLNVRVIVAEHPNGKLMCSTGDGCGQTCQNASACNSFVDDPA